MRSLQSRLTEVMECCAAYDGGWICHLPRLPSPQGKSNYCDRFLPGTGALIFPVSERRPPIGWEAVKEVAARPAEGRRLKLCCVKDTGEQRRDYYGISV
ncbi:hypothetical protein VZT92_004393 [Zoarces viviparus]|uniref:Uncharacterized protein n=1 Tax=Zoarces viviparus TaxID=48416 RepID=A0AAW1FXT8_ZOAVI